MKGKEMTEKYGAKNPHDDFQDQWLGLKDLEVIMNLVISVSPDNVWAIKQLASGRGRLLGARSGAAPRVIWFKCKRYKLHGVYFAE
jgi:hypothetical protein